MSGPDLSSALRAYWDKRPCNVRHSRQPVGSRDFFIEVAARRYRVEPHLAPFAGMFKWNGQQVLDVGCGIGTDALSFALQGAYVTAIESSLESLKFAAQHAGCFRPKAIHFVHADFTTLQRFRSPYALIWCYGVLHHAPEPALMLRQFARRMAADSELRLMVYAKWSLKNLTNHLGWTRPEAQAGCPLVRTYSKRGIKRLLERNGFKVISIQKTHHFTYSIPEYKQGREVVAFPWTILPGFLLRLVKRFFGWHLLVKARLES